MCGVRLPATCRACGTPLLEDARFCSQCGTPVVVDPAFRGVARQVRSKVGIDNPFLRIRARSLVLWVIASITVLIVVYVLALVSSDSNLEDIDPFFDALIFDAWLYGLFVGWGLWKAARTRLDFGSLIGHIPAGYRWRSVVWLVAILIVFSASSFWLFLYLLAVNVPEVANFRGTEDLFVTGEVTQYPGLYNAEVFVVVVFVAPVVEEFIFRGMLLTRWSFKWGSTIGIIVSSLVFALLHPNMVGAFAFGVVMSLLYIRTRTLLIPMTAHLLNNLFVTVMSALALTAETEESVALIDDLESGLILAVVGAFVTLPLLLWYVVRNWPRANQTVPYLSPSA